LGGIGVGGAALALLGPARRGLGIPRALTS